MNDGWSSTNMMFKPKVIGFMCNWSLPIEAREAILPGTSRIQGYPKIRIIPVMCTGRVDPAFIIRAFEMGADGILVGGCHPGDCHYTTGDLKVEKRMENTKKLLKLLGLGPERLCLEWISASEGAKLAQVVGDFIDSLLKTGPNPLRVKVSANEPPNDPVSTKRVVNEIIKKTNVQYCLECGKCSSSCPISRVNDTFSPRRTVERFVLGFDDRILSSEELWTCLACYQCSERCPSDVRYPEFVRACRSIAPKEVMEGLCAHRGISMALSRIMIYPKIEQDRMGWLPEGAEFSKRGDLLYFVGCLPYFDVVFEDFNLEILKIPKSVVRILNRVGIKPALLTNEKCCGHDLLWTGDFENFEKLAKINVASIKETGAKRVVTACAECYRTIKKDYAEFLGNLDFEVLHISELLSELVANGKLEFDAILEREVVYQDSCRLGRHMGVYEPPRKVIASLPGTELVEMERTRENAVCCGVNAWLSCDKYHKEVRMERLREAKNTGADLLVTTCPKCQIHWKCLASEKLPVNLSEITMEMRDLSVLVAEAMNLI
jgi:Fe-S oxidoreductase/coenzyme F420-reducing hydrogenase delta subunit